MHDDQHGTAVVVLAALRGANTVLGKDVANQRVVISGAGAAGVACAKILLAAGIGEVTVVDSRGIVHAGRDGLNPVKAELAEVTNAQRPARRHRRGAARRGRVRRRLVVARCPRS